MLCNHKVIFISAGTLLLSLNFSAMAMNVNPASSDPNVEKVSSLTLPKPEMTKHKQHTLLPVKLPFTGQLKSLLRSDWENNAPQIVPSTTIYHLPLWMKILFEGALSILVRGVF